MKKASLNEAEEAWQWVRMRFMERSDRYEEQKENCAKALEHAFDFMEAAFGNGQEMVIFITSLNTGAGSIEFLKEYNLLNDEKYAEMYIKDRLRSQGRNKIKYALIRKGVSEDILLDKLSNIDTEDENDTAFKLAEKKYNILKKKESDKYKLSQKLFRFLLSKGYDYDCCNSIVRRLTNNEYME